MKTLGIIPARYASTRFPGKPLVDILGKSMIQRVFEQVEKAKLMDKVIVATDDQRIFAHVVAFGGTVQMTRADHLSGTDRCAEIAENFAEFDLVVNIQGDEPFIDPSQIDQLIQLLHDRQDFDVATLAKKIKEEAELFSPNIVKLLWTQAQQAIYFSRHPIPFVRNAAQEAWLAQQDYYKHIGIYAFRRTQLLTLAALAPSRLEQAESLEQLRWLENGYRIGVGITELESMGIDTPEDLKKIIKKQA
ncbi:MAG: 3-deoxy-manno-octulosonate cytidylyltransferase [Saprospiraceae bacterium]